MLFSLLLLYFMVLLSLLLLQQIGLMSVVFISVFRPVRGTFETFPNVRSSIFQLFFCPSGKVFDILPWHGDNMLFFIFFIYKCVIVVRHAAEWQPSHRDLWCSATTKPGVTIAICTVSLIGIRFAVVTHSRQFQPVYSLTLLKPCCQSQSIRWGWASSFLHSVALLAVGHTQIKYFPPRCVQHHLLCVIIYADV